MDGPEKNPKYHDLTNQSQFKVQPRCGSGGNSSCSVSDYWTGLYWEWGFFLLFLFPLSFNQVPQEGQSFERLQNDLACRPRVKLALYSQNGFEIRKGKKFNSNQHSHNFEIDSNQLKVKAHRAPKAFEAWFDKSVCGCCHWRSFQWRNFLLYFDSCPKKQLRGLA